MGCRRHPSVSPIAHWMDGGKAGLGPLWMLSPWVSLPCECLELVTPYRDRSLGGGMERGGSNDSIKQQEEDEASEG